MALTDAQVLNISGYLKMWLTQIESQYPLILDQTQTVATRNAARLVAKGAFMNIVKMVNIVISTQGWTNPGTTFTAQEITKMGLDA